ncbi:PREDICTED: predicted GPI-anchored protein 58 [Capra hircus]|uniref:predicted GPI-anchored protein 58 n=1 Tax=Capra hircus TaxID=9925 RepID=UPI00084687B2|nr:PREDICTED: predicted GPI-anchored protein 58 [Capra hircus]
MAAVFPTDPGHTHTLSLSREPKKPGVCPQITSCATAPGTCAARCLPQGSGAPPQQSSLATALVPVTHTEPTGPTTCGSPTAPFTHTVPRSRAASIETAEPGVPAASFSPEAWALPAACLLPHGRRRFGSLSALTQRVSRTEHLARRLVPRPRNNPAPHLFPQGRRTPRPDRLGPTHRPGLSAASSRTLDPGKAPWPAAPLIAPG